MNRLLRWGLSFQTVPFKVAAKEMYAELFRLEPVPYQMMMVIPASLQPYIVGERWREYYAPTFDRVILALWLAAVVIVLTRIVRHRLWRRDRDLGDELPTIVGLWSLPTGMVLFVFYTRLGFTVTRYASDMVPAFAAASLCCGMALVSAVRRRSPALAGSAQLALAAAVALYISTGWSGWATHLSQPVDRKTVEARLADIDAHSSQMPAKVPDHFKCNAPRGPSPVHSHHDD